MKNAKQYEKKVKSLLGKLPKASEHDRPQEPINLVVFAILAADISEETATKGYEALMDEYVDINELRVSPEKDVIETLGREFPFVRDKVADLAGVLGSIYERNFAMNMDYLAEMSKREQRRHLTELGCDAYVEALVSLQAMGAHAIPVDQGLVDCLHMEELIHPESDVADVQGFLERIIAHKDAEAAHQFFREFVAKHAKELAKIHQQRMDAQRDKRREADARAKAEAEAELAEERGRPTPKAQKQKTKTKKTKKTKKTGTPKKSTKSAQKAPATGKSSSKTGKDTSESKPDKSKNASEEKAGKPRTGQAAGKKKSATSKARKTKKKSSSASSKKTSKGKKSKKARSSKKATKSSKSSKKTRKPSK